MSLSRQHFQAIADALYSAFPGPRPDYPEDGQVEADWAARCRQWIADRDAVASVLRRFNSRFSRDRFNFWTEHGKSESAVAAARGWVVQGYYSTAHGWEDVDSQPTRETAQESKATYVREDPDHRYRVRRATA